jgi:ubiquinone/menaquinone biosynthesis C-methylase UbiE
MKRSSEKKNWDEYWEASSDLDDVYSNDGRIVAHLGQVVDLNGLKVLEVGAGSGRDSDDIATRGGIVYTLDYSEKALDLMRISLKSPIEIVCGDATAVPFRSGSLDVVFHQGLLEHFRNPELLIRENHRILKKGGLLLVDVPQRLHYYTLLKHILMVFGKWFAGWETEFTPRQLQELVRRQGFEIVAMYGENLCPPIWYRGLRRILRRFRLKLPMYPLPMNGLRRKLKKSMPPAVRLNTSMILGCIARKV